MVYDKFILLIKIQKDSNDFLQTIKLHIDNFFEMKNDLCMNGTLLKYNNSNEHILFDQSGIYIELNF